MRHHAEDAPVADRKCRRCCAASHWDWPSVRSALTVTIDVAKHDAAFILETVEGVGVGEIVAVVVGDRNPDGFALAVGGDVNIGPGVVDTEIDIAAHVASSDALRISTPGSRPVSHSIWKPLQMPSTGVPDLALATTSRMIGECAAIAPQRR